MIDVHEPVDVAGATLLRPCPAADEFEFVGRHLLASYVGCDAAALADETGLLAAMKAAVKASGATLISSVQHSFTPSGMTAVMLLSESHASIHTYPEHRACFVDLFTCGRSCSAERFDAVMCKYLKPTRVDRRTILRQGAADGRLSDDRFNEWAA
ncbi:MAG TPA: adenosylmethionine decarboxylase [Pirellulales bacterium]|nr:adenosylmethionine decarboxylase [Pirellulales bacterium]